MEAVYRTGRGNSVALRAWNLAEMTPERGMGFLLKIENLLTKVKQCCLD
jgi:hypothetical protein